MKMFNYDICFHIVYLFLYFHICSKRIVPHHIKLHSQEEASFPGFCSFLPLTFFSYFYPIYEELGSSMISNFF